MDCIAVGANCTPATLANGLDDKMTTLLNDFFFSGGQLDFDAPSYITRPADSELLETLRGGSYCYVLTTRQIGKSSLKVRAMHLLQEAGEVAIDVDLQGLGGDKNTSAEQWFRSIIQIIYDKTDLEFDLKAWWQTKSDLTLPARFQAFFVEQLLPQTEERPITIFLDEIDSCIPLPFADDLFIVIRALYNARHNTPSLRRLRFVLLGVASPTDLIKDKRRTPFNIGKRIELEQFSRPEIALFTEGWPDLDPSTREQLLDRIYHWTQGHPYLTQAVCGKIVESKTADVDQLIKTTFFANKKLHTDDNIKFVSNRLLEAPQKNKLLATYRKVLHNRKIQFEAADPIHSELMLSGIVKQDDHGYLQVRNPIYANIFTDGWAKDNIDTNWKTRILVGTSVFLTVALLVLVGTLLYDNLHIARRYSNLKNIFHEAQQTNEKRHALAEIFMLDLIYDADGYKREALNELFFRIDTQAEQMELLRLPSYPDEEAIHDVELIARELLPTLADLDGNNANLRLLETIATSLQGIKTKQGESLPISYWVEARHARFATPPDYEKAIEAYNQALQIEVDQPALLYERADTYFLQGKPAQALDDLSQMLEIAKKSSLATPTPLPTAIPTLTGTLPISVTEPAITLPVATESTATIIVTTPTKIEDKRTAIPTQTATPLPTATPQPPPANEPFEAAFPTGWEMQKEIKALILRHSTNLDVELLRTNYPILNELEITLRSVQEQKAMFLQQH